MEQTASSVANQIIELLTGRFILIINSQAQGQKKEKLCARSWLHCLYRLNAGKAHLIAIPNALGGREGLTFFNSDIISFTSVLHLDSSRRLALILTYKKYGFVMLEEIKKNCGRQLEVRRLITVSISRLTVLHVHPAGVRHM